MSHPNPDAADSTEIVDDVSNIQLTSGVAAAASTVVETNFSPTAEDNRNQNWKGKRRGSRSWLMYRAALGGDWAAAEALLKQDPSLASDVITERGDRALHLAIAMKHKKFVQNLVEWMSPSELELPDMSGDNACCYAAMSGTVEIAQLLVSKNGRFLVARNKDNYTPLQYSILGGERKMISFFLEKTGVDRLSQAEWFHLLLKAIASKMYGMK